MDLQQALEDFDATETTLQRLETVWSRIVETIPDGVSYPSPTVQNEYDDLVRTFHDLVAGLPAISGWTVKACPIDLDQIAQWRLDAHDLGEVSEFIRLDRTIHEPGDAICEYRHRLRRARRSLVRQRAQVLIDEVGRSLSQLIQRVARDSAPVQHPAWGAVREGVGEIERILGSALSRTGRWGELARHIAFGHGCDVHDVAEHDWPSVLKDIRSALYDAHEPLPVSVSDLAELLELKPSGRVCTRLAWEVLDADAFERLIYNIIGDAEGYENPLWLTQTNAPDRARDLSADRVVTDSLSGVTRQRIIIQCKH